MSAIMILKKVLSLSLLLISLSPLYANYRLHRFITYHQEQKNNNVADTVSNILEERTGIKISRHALVSKLFPSCVSIINTENTEEEVFPEDFAFTLPYLTDDTVLVTRIGEDIEIKKEINSGSSSKIYAGYKNDDIFRNWLAESNFENIAEESETLEDALEMIMDGEADFTMLPFHMATAIITGASLDSYITTSRALFPVEYRIPVDKDDGESIVKLNDALFTMEQDGTLLDIYYQTGVKSKVVIEQETKLFKPVLLTVFLLFFCILSIIYFIRYFTIYKSSHKEKKVDDIEKETSSPGSINEKITMLTQKNISLSEQIAENKNTDPYTGFYNTNRMRLRINDSFVLYAKKGVPFSIVIINTFKRHDSMSDTLDTLKEDISRLQEENGANIETFHNGFGVFYILFPAKGQDEVIRTINKAECRFKNFSLLEYKGQDQYEFLGGLGVW